MALEFFLAKNSSPSAKANGIALHSAYNPEVESERFVQGLDAPFVPACVIILEGGLSYCADFLRKRFPGAKIGALRFCADFAEYDKKWDFTLSADFLLAQNFSQAQNAAGSTVPLSDRLFDALGEEGLFATLFYEWPPAARAWPQETKKAWNEIKAATQKAATVLATREHFGKRWLKNKIRFFERIQSAAVFQKIKKPVVICASGPSLEAALPSIKKTRDKIFLCALSSSLPALARNKIKPDLCLSCDGGFWAKKHLDILRKDFEQSPLAVATEAALPASLFKKKTIVPLCYDDDALSKDFFEALEIPFSPARRNGTVSGSALELFLEAAEGPIFFSGLDMQSWPKSSHARPNALQTLSEEKDFRLAPKATRAARASLKNEALDLYAAWFSNADLRGKSVYRITGSEPFKRSLGKIKDISAAEFESAANNNSLQGQNAAAVFGLKKIEGGDRLKTIRRVFDKWQKTEAFMSEQFPTDSIMIRREKDAEQKERRLLALKEKCKSLAKELFKDQEAAL